MQVGYWSQEIPLTETSTDVGQVGRSASTAEELTQPWSPRRSTATLARVRRLVEASAKRLGKWEATEMLKPATRHGRRSTLWEWVSGAKQQVVQEAGGPAPVEGLQYIPRRMGARCERQPSRLEMKKLLLTGVAALFLATGGPAHAQGVAISGPPCAVPEQYETDVNKIAAYNRCRARYYAEMNCKVGDRVACLRLKLLGKEVPK